MDTPGAARAAPAPGDQARGGSGCGDVTGGGDQALGGLVQHIQRDGATSVLEGFLKAEGGADLMAGVEEL